MIDIYSAENDSDFGLRCGDMVLKPGYREFADMFKMDDVREFLDYYDGGSCSCHVNPPCSWCTHPGNYTADYSDIANENNWEHVIKAQVRRQARILDNDR